MPTSKFSISATCFSVILCQLLLFVTSVSRAGSHILLTEEGSTFQDTGHELVEVLLNDGLLKERGLKSDRISDIQIDPKNPNLVWVLIENSAGIYPSPNGQVWVSVPVLEPKSFAANLKAGKYLFVVILPYPKRAWSREGLGEKLPETRYTLETSAGVHRWIPRGKFQLQIRDLNTGRYLGDPSYHPNLFGNLPHRCMGTLTPNF